MPVEQGDFVEIEYTAKLKEDNQVFDTTNVDEAKKANIYNENTKYEPVIICVGEKQIVRGIDERLVGKEAGNFTFELTPDEAFGRKDPAQIQMIPSLKFAQQNVKPFPGLQLNVDGRIGIVKLVTGGRILVDFNHPLAGKPIVYEISLKRVITDLKEKVEAVLKFFNIPGQVAVEEKTAKITLPTELPEQAANPLKATIKRLTKVEDVSFEVKKSS